MGDHDGGRWADWRSTTALTGVPGDELAWMLADREVRYSLTRPAHEGTLMVSVDDVERVVEERPTARAESSGR